VRWKRSSSCKLSSIADGAVCLCISDTVLAWMLAARTLIQAFISSRLDYCNSLLYGVSDNLIRRVQSVQNAAARLLTGARRHGHISSVLRQLHWLPVQRRVDYKLACFVFSCLSGHAYPSTVPRRRHTSGLQRSLTAATLWRGGSMVSARDSRSIPGRGIPRNNLG